MHPLKVLIIRHLNGKQLILFAGLTGVLFLYMYLVPIAALEEFLNGLKILDEKGSGYDVTYVKNLFATLGQEGRDLYLYKQIPVDLIFPWLYVPTLCLLMAWLLKKVNLLDRSWFYLCTLPIIGGIFDLLENLNVAYLLIHEQPLTSGRVALASWCTQLKWLFLTLAGLAILMLLFVWMVRLYRRASVAKVK